MQKDWTLYKIEDIAKDIAMGPFGSNIKRDNFVSSGVPIIRGGNLNEGRFKDHDFVFLTEIKANSLKRSIAYPNELVFTHRGTIGQVGIIPENSYPRYVVSQSQMRLAIDKILAEPFFVFYYFRSKYGQQEWLKNSSQVGVPAIAQPTASLKGCSINLPPLLEQKAIASILSTLDDKIENNLVMNKTLEDMAMALYRHWFEDFGPFLDGEFVDSELGEIPKGWEVKRLDEIAYKKSETFNFSKKQDVVFINTGDVQEGRFLHSNRISKVGLPGQAKKAIAKNDILYSEIRPKNKRYAFVNFDAEDYVVSTKFMIINPKTNILTKLLYRILTMQNSVDNFNMIAEGRSGTFPQITFDAISEVAYVLPPLKIQNDYQSIVDSFELKQDEIYLENQTLTKLRDTLLPKLISGEVRIKEVEQQLENIL